MRGLMLASIAAVCLAASPDMDRIAESYVKLVLAVGLHEPDYVDAYYGPPEWKAEVEREKPGLEVIADRAAKLIADVKAVKAPRGEIERLRHQYLLKQLQSLDARVAMLRGKKFTFDEESAALYDAVAPVLPESHFKKILAKLDPLLPGAGTIQERNEAFQKRFYIPREKLDAVFRAAIEEARKRTLRHIKLPANESFTVEYVTGQVWSAYNWYKGDSRSVIQVNTDLPVNLGFALRLACHEGYPGHHVYNALLEDRLTKGRGWKEFSVYPLYSPQSLIAEGTAEYGVGVAFPEKEQVEFVSNVLAPLAGIDPAEAKAYHAVRVLIEELNYAGNEAARGYLDAKFGKDEAIRWLTTYGLMSGERAGQRLRFIEKNRAYVINYNLGQDLVARYMKKRGATARNPEKMWKELEALLSSPRLPSGP